MTKLIQEGRFDAHLQPIIDVKRNQILGYESLLRTKDMSVSPGELFSYASRSGLQYMLDQKARKTAVKAKSELLPHGQKILLIFHHRRFMYQSSV